MNACSSKWGSAVALRWTLGALLVLACTSLAARPSYAQDRRVAAEAAFEEGLALFEKGRFAEACPKLGAAVDLTDRASLGGVLLFAECQEKLGRNASAWALYREVAAKAERASQSDRVQKAREGEARVAPLLHQLTIRVSPSVAALRGLRVMRGSVEVAPEIYGVSVPVDPGPMVVHAEAPGYAPRELKVGIPATAGKSEVVLDALERAPTGSASSTPPAPTPPPGGSESLGALGVVGLITAGTGVLGMGASAFVMLSAKSSYDEAVVDCSSGVCTTDAQKAAVDAARDTGDIGTVVFVGGAALTAIGASLLVIDLVTDEHAGDTRSSRASLRLGPSGIGWRAAF